MASVTALPAEKGSDILATENSASSRTYVDSTAEESYLTRLGLTLRSFGKADVSVDQTRLHKTIKGRHLHMIAVGGCVGAGLFVGSGGALAKGGPAALLIAFAMISIMIVNVVWALGELAVMYPISGGFYMYANRFISPSWGATMGWNYVFEWAACLPLELTVSALTMGYWQLNVSTAVWISLFLGVLILISLFGARGFAEEEFWSAFVKLFCIIVFIFMAFIFMVGGGPKSGAFHTYQGTKTWSDPGAFSNGFHGLCTVFVTAAFALNGTEMVGLAAAEAQDPAKALPRAVKQVAWRCISFYGLALFFVGLLVPYNDKRLLGAVGANPLIDVSTSPFVIAVKDAGILGFDSFLNAAILVSVLSVGQSAIYGGSRTLTALAEQGYAPRLFTRIDRAGRPTWSTFLIICCGGIAYISMAAGGNIVLEWLVSITGLIALFSWGTICVAHIRFRKAWAYNGRSLNEIPYKAPLGVYGSWLGLTIVILALIAQLYVAVHPLEGSFSAATFFKSYLSVFVVAFCWLFAYFWKRGSLVPISRINIDEGRRDFDWKAYEETRRITKRPQRIFVVKAPALWGAPQEDVAGNVANSTAAEPELHESFGLMRLRLMFGDSRGPNGKSTK